MKPLSGYGFDSQGMTLDSRSKKARAIGMPQASPNEMVGLGHRAVDIQRKMPRLQTTVSENGNTVDLLTGTDLLGTIAIGSSPASAGQILFTQQISPSLFVNTRLQQFSSLYQRYRFRRIHFVYEPVANATQSGQLLGFADFDVDNILTTNNPDNMNIGAAHQGQAITQIWDPKRFDMGQLFTFTDLYTEAGAEDASDPRLSIQGVFYVLAASAIGNNLPLGNIYVDYEIEFSIPFLSTSRVVSDRNSAQTVAVTTTHAYASDLYTFGVTTPLLSFGPIGVSYSTGDATVEWTGVQTGDLIDCWFSIRGFDPLSGGTPYGAGLSPSCVGGNIGITSNYLAVSSSGASVYGWLNLQIACVPIAGSVSLSLNNVVATEFNVGATVTAGWVLTPNSVALSRRRTSARTREMEAFKAQIRDLRAMFENNIRLTQVSNPAVVSTPARVSGPPLSGQPPTRMEFHQVDSTNGSGASGKVFCIDDLSDSEDEDHPSHSRTRSEMQRQLRRAAH